MAGGNRKKNIYESIDSAKNAAPVFLVALVCFGLLPTTQAVIPAPDGGYGPPAYGAGNTQRGKALC